MASMVWTQVVQKIHKETGKIAGEREFSVSRHFGEGLVKFVGDRLELLLLVDELILWKGPECIGICKGKECASTTKLCS